MTTPCWHLLLDLSGRPGWQNMALDQAMLDHAARGERWLRLYRWAPHCLSFGRHEPALRRYHRGRIAERGVDVVRRPTGGRAVWHADELTYSLAAPCEVLGGLRRAYLEIHRMLLGALGLLGIGAELAPDCRPTKPGSGACFASPAGGEILIAGRKVVGSAQLREGNALLQHGSILLAGRQTLVHDITIGGAPPDLSGPLADMTGRRPDVSQVAEAVAAAASDRWAGQWARGGVPDTLLDAASSHEERFRSPEWTWSA